jgi:SOS response regulatory protein OraA/RecX
MQSSAAKDPWGQFDLSGERVNHCSALALQTLAQPARARKDLHRRIARKQISS